MDFTCGDNVESKFLNSCRCCRKNGCSQDISTEYYYSGRQEVYEDMIRDTFNIQITHQHDGVPSNSRLICEDCIIRLRDATAFKLMVVCNEESFVTYWETLLTKDQVNKIPLELKEEPIENETSSNIESGVKTDEDSCDDDEILSNIKAELAKVNTTSLLGKVRKRKRHKEDKFERCQLRSYSEDVHKTEVGKDWSKIVERRGNGPVLRENSLKLIANSTICVFQWNKSRYRCFCCTEPFSDINLLREHTNSQHSLENIEKKIIIQQNRLVKAETSFLLCKICNEEVDDLSELKNHLTDTHGVQFSSTENLLVPFKIQNGDLRCQICFESFDVFRLLNIHMNRHYQKQVCHICGAGFSNLVFLNLHKSRSHRPLHCKQCDLFFNTKTDKRHHDASSHDVKRERKLRFPCCHCGERFFQENLRVLHLVEKHGMRRPEFRCNFCEKVFVTRSLLNNHVKCVHMKEKNQECDVCHHLFYTKSDLQRHRVTHTGEKKYRCSVCNNNFATKDSLRRHMKRTHAVH